MVDMLKTGIDWLAGRRNSHMVQTVTYQRGVETFPISATMTSADYEVMTEDGATLHAKSIDWLVDADTLVFGFDNIQGEPEIGDRILITIDDVDRIYEVLDLEGQGHFRLSDQYGKVLRIHTKEISGDDCVLG